MILVTGGSGLLGSQLVKLLIEKGHNVRALYNSKDSITKNPLLRDFSHSNLEWMKCDILELDALEMALENVDSVFHCAALVSFSSKDAKMMHQVNVEGTANLVNLCLSKGITDFYHTSSIATLGRDISGNQDVTEKDSFIHKKRISAYAWSKYRAEMEVWRASEEGLNVAMVNPSIILGPCDFSKGTGKLFSLVAKGLKFYNPGSTGFVYSKDVAKVLIYLFENKLFGQRFIVNGENASYKKLFFGIAENLKVAKPKYCPPKILSQTVAFLLLIKQVFTGKEAAITRESVRSAYTNYRFSSDKIKKVMGIEFVGLDEMVKITCDSFTAEKQA